MRILVTGATGFVGRTLCREIERQGHLVRSVVRDATRAPNVAGEIVSVGSIDASTAWSSALRDVDAVVHLAARVHVMKETSADPLAEFRDVNVRGTEALARAAVHQGVRRFVYVSSIKVNGEATHGSKFTPDDLPEPQDPYGVSKWEAEQALREIEARSDLKITIVRPPLVYGPHVRGNFLRLLDVIERGIPLPLASVRNKRSMIYSRNLASLLVACATDERASGRTFLASDDDDLSTPDLIRRIGEVLGKRARLLHCPPAFLQVLGRLVGKREEIARLVGSLEIDSSALRRELGWKPPYSVAHGLSDTGRWFVEDRRHGAGAAKGAHHI